MLKNFIKNWRETIYTHVNLFEDERIGTGDEVMCNLDDGKGKGSKLIVNEIIKGASL